MAMDPNILAPTLKIALQDNLLADASRGFRLVDEEGNETNLTYMCQAIADAVAVQVINHIKSFAEGTSQVTTTVGTGIPVATTGSPTAQTGATTAPGTGSGTGTISPGSIR